MNFTGKKKGGGGVAGGKGKKKKKKEPEPLEIVPLLVEVTVSSTESIKLFC